MARLKFEISILAQDEVTLARVVNINVIPGSALSDWVDLDSTNFVARFFRARFVP